MLESVEEMWKKAFESKSMEPVQLEGLVSINIVFSIVCNVNKMNPRLNPRLNLNWPLITAEHRFTVPQFTANLNLLQQFHFPKWGLNIHQTLILRLFLTPAEI